MKIKILTFGRVMEESGVKKSGIAKYPLTLTHVLVKKNSSFRKPF